MIDHNEVCNRGAEDHRQGHEKEDNPYDAIAYPGEHADWLYGWKTSKEILEQLQPLIPSDDRHFVRLRKNRECRKS